MKNLLYVIAIALLLAACSDSGSGVKPFTPHFVGDYKVTTPTDAKLVGDGNIKSSQFYTSSVEFDSTKTDTVIVTNPVGFGLTFSRDSTSDGTIEKINFHYDSYEEGLTENVEYVAGLRASWAMGDETIGIRHKRTFLSSTGVIKYTGLITYPCSVHSTAPRDIQVTYRTPTQVNEGEFYARKRIIFKTDSLATVLNEIRQCK